MRFKGVALEIMFLIALQCILFLFLRSFQPEVGCSINTVYNNDTSKLILNFKLILNQACFNHLNNAMNMPVFHIVKLNALFTYKTKKKNDWLFTS